MTPAITSFSGTYFFLSNFFPHPIYFDGSWWPTAEHAFQAAKTRDEGEREKIRSAKTAFEAKKLGRKAKMRLDWYSIRVDVMRRILREKFTNSQLRTMLHQTGEAELIEGNRWGDEFWGVCDGVGENKLGKLLMEIRKER